MKLLLIIISSLAFLACNVFPGKPNREAYGWINFETIPTDSMGRSTGRSSWEPPMRMKIDYFLTYENNDSILMITPEDIPPMMFRKVQIKATKWKPRPDYANKLLFLGTYIAKELGGIYFSYYAATDRSSLLQIEYTNPGNMVGATMFTKDSINILKNNGIIPDPKDELPEAEEVHSSSAISN
jgi:hypothetical protein